jgi:hypothetical protein
MVPGRIGLRVAARKCMIKREGPSAPSLKNEVKASAKPAGKSEIETTVYRMSTEQRLSEKWEEIKTRPTAVARRWLASQVWGGQLFESW